MWGINLELVDSPHNLPVMQEVYHKINKTWAGANFTDNFSTVIKSFCSFSVVSPLIATNFCTWHDSTAVMPCAKFCNNHCQNWDESLTNFPTNFRFSGKNPQSLNTLQLGEPPPPSWLHTISPCHGVYVPLTSDTPWLCRSVWQGWSTCSELILGSPPANERQCYFVTMSLIGWAQT